MSVYAYTSIASPRTTPTLGVGAFDITHRSIDRSRFVPGLDSSIASPRTTTPSVDINHRSIDRARVVAKPSAFFMLISSPSPRARSYAPLRVERRECGFGARARARAAAASDDAAAEDARTRETRARSESHAHATTTKKETTRRRNIAVIMASTGVAMSIARAREAEAEYGDAVYMESLQGAGKDYGKSEILYSDFARTRSGLQYKDVREGVANAATYDGERGAIAIVDWDGYTIGYYGRPVRERRERLERRRTGRERENIEDDGERASED